MKKYLFAASLFIFNLSFFILNCSAQIETRTYINDPLLAPRAHNVDFQHLKLEVSFEPQKGLVKGKVTHYFTPLRQKIDSVVLDGVHMDIKEVVLNGKPAKFRNDSETVIVYTPSLSWGSQDSMTIKYECTPRKGLYFIGWNDKAGICRKQIWSQGQGIDNRHWIPMYDEMNDKFTTETLVTFDTAYKVLANGKMIDKKLNSDGTYTWHYKMSHPYAPYQVMIGIGKYDIKETHSASGVPMHLYYYPDWKDRVQATYMLSEKMIDFYEKEIGVPYPWKSYSQLPVQDFMYGAMENTTATVFGDFLFCDDRAFLDRPYYGVNAHELAHQWFGDDVTVRSDAHHWLQESFATYYDWLFEKEYFGKDHYDWIRRESENSALSESKKNDYQVANSEAGTARHYPKGAFVLSMLKNVLGGRETYNKCIKHYLETHSYSNVDTHDLLIACEDATGMQLDWFFEEWLYKGGEPDYNISFRDITENASSKTTKHYSEFHVEQVQELSELTGLPQPGGTKTNAVNDDPFVHQNADNQNFQPAGLFKMPIWFEVHYTDGTADKKMIWIEKQTEIIRIPIPIGKKVDFALFDPDNEVLKTVSFAKSFEMLQSQTLKANNVLDRYDALFAMEHTNIERKRDFLISYYNNPKEANFYMLKAEIIKQLSPDNNPKSIALIKSALTDPDVKVRKSVLDNLKLLPEELLPSVEKLLKDSSYDIVLNVLDYLSFANPDKTEFYLDQTKDVEGFPGRNVKIKWLEIASMANEKYIDQLVSYTSNSYEFRTRINAISSLKKLNYLDANEIENLVDGMLSANSRLSGPAAGALKFFYEQLHYKRPIVNYVESHNWEPWQEKIIHSVVK